MTLRTVGVRLTAEIAEYQSKMKAAAQTTRDFKGELDKAAQKGNVEQLTRSAAVLGLGMVGVAAGAVKMRMDFDKAMSAVSAATHASAGDLDQLRQAAIKAGQDTQYSATDAADAITELSKAGVKTADILGGGLKGALSLAAAGQLDVGDAAEIAASALTQFRLSGSAVPHVADLLAAAAGKAQGSVHDVGEALNQSGLVASQFGLSIEDTTGALAEFANAGLTGSDAGTSFKTMLLAMPRPSTEAASKMKALGISFYDAHGQFIGLSGVAQVLQDKLHGLTEKQRESTLAQIFGTDAIRSASVLYADGAAGVEKWKGAVNDSGYASKTAAALTDNLAGDLERLKGSLETVAIQAGGGATNGLRTLTQGANGAVNAFSELPGWVQQSITVMSGVGGAGLLAAAGFLKARSTAKDFMDELRDMGPKGEAAARGIGKISSIAGKLGLVGAGAVAVYTGMKLFGDWVNHFSAPVARDIDKMTDAMREFAASGKVTGELAKTFGPDLQGLNRDLAAIQRSQAELAKLDNVKNGPAGTEGRDRAVAAMGAKIKQMSAQAQTDINATDETLAKVASEGGVTQAKIAFDRLAKATGLTIDRLPKYSAAAKGAADASSGMAKGFGDATANTKTLASSLQSAIEAGQKLTDVWNQLHGATLGSDKAMLDANNAIKDMKKELTESAKAAKGHKLALDGNSTAALKNRVAVGDAAKAAVAAAQAKYEETGSVEKASTVYDSYIGQLKKTLKQAGLTKGQIDTLIGAYGKMPPAIATPVSAPGAKQAKVELDKAWEAAQRLEGKYEAHATVSGEAKVDAAFRHLSSEQQALKSGDTLDRFHGGMGDGPGYAGGGWTGPGSKFEPAGFVHADEYVVNKDARGPLEQQKPGGLDYMNRTGRWPVEGDGGGVWPFPIDVSKTKIPQIAALGGGAGPGGGQTYKWILDVVHHAFPGLHATSTFRKGAVTLSGNRSYHAVGRAVDWPPSKALAEWVNTHYGHATRELITPWNSLNIKNGARHAYSGEIFAQHAGLGRWKGNAHDHWAMAHGGVIPEHVIGVGRSGRTYEFGEAGPERVTPMRGYARGGYVNVAPSSSTSSRSGTRLDYYDSLLSATNAVAQFTAALKENKRALSTRTQKGRDDRAALISGVRAAQEAAKARYEETGSIRAANKVYDEYIHKLDAAMKKMHVNTKTRREMIKAYSEKPKYDVPAASAPSNSSGRIKSVQDYAAAEQSLSDAKTAFAWTKPTFSARTVTGRSELQTLFTYLGAAEQAAQSQFAETGNAGSATKLYNSYLTQLRAILARSGMSRASIDSLFKQYGRITLSRNRWGGLYQHAATGALSEAQIAPGGPTRYAWAEPSTGGELFAPRYGDPQKTRREVGWAVANWWGGQVNWGGKGGGGARHMTIEAPITIQLGAETITRQVRFEVDTALGQVATAVIHQSA